MKKAIRLNQQQLRGLIKETLQERFGAYDREPMDDDMMFPSNFEGAGKETFQIFVDKIKEAFVQGHMDMVEAGFAPETHTGFGEMIHTTADQLGEEIMKMIEDFSGRVAEEM